MLTPVALITAAAIASAPVVPPPSSARATQLALYLVKVNPAASAYAGELASSIELEARRHSIDSALLVAIVWTESYLQLVAPGSSGERGPWQIMRGSSALLPAWARLRWTRQLRGHPDRPWQELGRQEQDAALRDPVVATYLAAWLVAWHVRRCTYPTTPRCYARYNSGGPRIRWSYARAIGRRAANVRRALDRPADTL